MDRTWIGTGSEADRKGIGLWIGTGSEADRKRIGSGSEHIGTRSEVDREHVMVFYYNAL